MNMVSIVDAISVGAGAYMLYAWYLLKFKGEITKTVLMREEINIKKCKNLEAYKAYVAPKMLVMAAACVLYGAAGLLNTYVFTMPVAVYLVIMAVFLAALVWYAVSTKKALEIFW